MYSLPKTNPKKVSENPQSTQNQNCLQAWIYHMRQAQGKKTHTINSHYRKKLSNIKITLFLWC
jgi:hypothetical protein